MNPPSRIVTAGRRSAMSAAQRSAGEKAETAQLIRLGLRELSK